MFNRRWRSPVLLSLSSLALLNAGTALSFSRAPSNSGSDPAPIVDPAPVIFSMQTIRFKLKASRLKISTGLLTIPLVISAPVRLRAIV
jgi:hypothetical protein